MVADQRAFARDPCAAAAARPFAIGGVAILRRRVHRGHLRPSRERRCATCADRREVNGERLPALRAFPAPPIDLHLALRHLGLVRTMVAARIGLVRHLARRDQRQPLAGAQCLWWQMRGARLRIAMDRAELEHQVLFYPRRSSRAHARDRLGRKPVDGLDLGGGWTAARRRSSRKRPRWRVCQPRIRRQGSIST